MDNNVPTPQSPTSPPPVQPPSATPQPQSPYTDPSVYNQAKKPGKGKMIGIIAAIIGALVLLGGGVLLLLAFPNIQARSVADNFITLTKEGKHDEALKLTDSDDDDESTLRLIESLDSSLGDSTYKVTSVDDDNGTKLVKHTVDNDDDKRFVIGVKKIDGKMKVVGIIINIGGATTSAQDTSSTEQKQASTTPTTCLPHASIKEFWRYEHGWDFYFEADSNKVRHEDSSVRSIAEMKKFYDNNKQYNFTFDIDVTLYQGNANDKASQDLALLRASVVAYNMDKRGIPYSHIRLGKVTYSAGNPNNPQYADGSRAAWVTINSECDALSKPQNIDTKVDSSYGL